MGGRGASWLPACLLAGCTAGTPPPAGSLYDCTDGKAILVREAGPDRLLVERETERWLLARQGPSLYRGGEVSLGRDGAALVLSEPAGRATCLPRPD